ncbi:MAG: glycosyltransferase, partial [bacterium]|nr:glycosyltransferase [bacterium]
MRRGLVHRNAVEAMMDEPGTKKIRVLHVLNNLDFGGAESYVYKLVKNLDGRRYESYLAYTCGGPFLEQFEALPVRSFQVGNRALNFRNWMSNGLAMWRLYLFARKNRIDVIHAHMFEVYFWVSFVAALARIPMVRTIHSIFKDVYPRAAFVERIFSHIPGRTIVLTAFSRSELIGFGIGPRKVEVIPNGIELPDSTTDFRVSADALKQKFGIEDGNVVGTVGRLSGHKNHEMFLKAAALVLTEMRGVMFVLVGDGPLRPSLESLVRELGIEEQVVFFGWSRDIYSAISV